MFEKLTLPVITFALLFTFTTVANATDGLTLPHGGYDESSNSCLSCHDIHEATGDYVLMRQLTVTSTCGTCHTLFALSPGQRFADNEEIPYIADYPGDHGDLGSATDLTAYSIDESEVDDFGGHRLGLGTDSSNEFADGAQSDGNYIPGGTSTLFALGNTGNVDATAYDATDGLYCASCHTPHGRYGLMLRGSDGNYATDKLLSSNPNHITDEVTVDDWFDDGANWCTRCHDKRRSDAPDDNGALHRNHPDSFCLTCHGNYSGQVDDGSNTGFPTEGQLAENGDDFPHTSPVQNLLSAAPDELCVTCHTGGSLP